MAEGGAAYGRGVVGGATCFRAEYRLWFDGFAVQERVLGRPTEGPFPGELVFSLFYAFDGRFRLDERGGGMWAAYDGQSSIAVPEPGVVMLARGREKQPLDALITPDTEGPGWTHDPPQPVTHDGRAAQLIRQRRQNMPHLTATTAPPVDSRPGVESAEVVIDDELGIGVSLHHFQGNSCVHRQALHSISVESEEIDNARFAAPADATTIIRGTVGPDGYPRYPFPLRSRIANRLRLLAEIRIRSPRQR